MQRILLTTIVASLIIVTFYRAFSHVYQPISKWDEKTNIDVVIHSLTHASFPVLYLNNKPFFEKPPLWYIATTIMVTVLGQSLFAFRFISTLAGIGIILLTALLAWRWWGIIAGITAWIVLLGTNQLFVTNAGGYFSSHTFNSADLDAMQILLIIIAFASCTSLFAHKRWPIIVGITTSLAFLTKGPLGIIPLTVSTVLLWHSSESNKSVRIAWIIFFITSVPWYVYMFLRFGFPFLTAHFGYHIIDRTLFAIEGHTSPPWYYLQLLSNHSIFFSWELFASSLLWVVAKKLYRDPKILYTLTLTILFVLLPSLANTRLAWYIFPFYPFAALVIGVAFADIAKRVRTLQYMIQ